MIRTLLTILSIDLSGEMLRGDVAIAVHQNNQRITAIVLHYQGLDHGVLVNTKLTRRHTGSTSLLIAIFVFVEGNPMFSKNVNGRR